VEALENRCLLNGSPLTNQGFVTPLYRDVLKRESDPGGLTAWSGVLDSGQENRAQVAQAFVNSVEYHSDVVQSFYGTFLHRAADPAGLNAWTNFLAQGGMQLQREAQLLGSQERDIVTIDRLYSEFLHRDPDPGGMSAFLAAFQGNQDHSDAGAPNSGTRTNVAGSPNTSADPPQAAIIPAELNDSSGSNSDPSSSGPMSGITLEQAMGAILSSPEYFAQADR
jgi:hypothetical protein